MSIGLLPIRYFLDSQLSILHCLLPLFLLVLWKLLGVVDQSYLFAVHLIGSCFSAIRYRPLDTTSC